MIYSDHVRLRTWAIEIAQTLLGDNGVDQGHDRRFQGLGGFVIHRGTGAWYCHAAQRGGHSTVAMVAFLRDCNSLDADQWGAAWLQAHPGEGSCTAAALAGDAEESAARTAANDATARHVLDAGVPLTDPRAAPAVAYLRSRAIEPPYPTNLHYLPDIWLEQLHRVGEGALVAELHASGSVLGVQVTWLDPFGAKSLHEPARQMFLLADPRAKAAMFTLQVPKDEVWRSKNTQERVVVEGVEDALSCWLAGVAPCVQAVLGAGRLKHVAVQAGETVVWFGDGDNAGAATTGVDALLLGGAVVKVTDTPAGADPNSLLQSTCSVALCELVEWAAPVELSLAGEIARLARLDQVDYDRQRSPIARKFGIRVGTLDDQVKQARPPSPAEAATRSIPVDPPWEGDVELGEVLDQALVQARRYIVASDTQLATVIVWSAHTHLCHNEMVRLQRTPRLALQSRTKGSGKTTTLELVRELSARGLLRGSYTASTIFRTIELLKPTYCLDETDRILRDDKSDLVAVLNNGDRRASAVVERAVPAPDGGWQVERFDTWSAVAFAGIDELPETLQDRSVCVRLQKVLAKAVPEHLRDGTSIELVELRRQLTAWGSALTELPDPELPEILLHRAGRVGDCWRPLIAIADLAGGQWPALIRAAAAEAATAQERPSELERLLASIRLAFDGQVEKDAARRDAGDKSEDSQWPDNQHRLRTTSLLAALLAEQGEDWNTAHRARPITAYYLRDALRNLLTPPKAQDWWTGPADQRAHHSGYSRLQFSKVWETHLAGDIQSTSVPPQGSGAAGAAGAAGATCERGGVAPEKPPFSESSDAPDAAPDAVKSAPDTGSAQHRAAPDDREPPASGGKSGTNGCSEKTSQETDFINENRADAEAAPDAHDALDATRGEGGEGIGGPDGAATPTTTGSGTFGRTGRRERHGAAAAIRAEATRHPAWKPSRLARSLGLPELQVVRALKGWTPPGQPGASPEESPA